MESEQDYQWRAPDRPEILPTGDVVIREPREGWSQRFYEMVLRRCHLILISDAAADPEYNFGDLGNAIRKVRIDLGVPIEFTSMPIFSRRVHRHS